MIYALNKNQFYQTECEEWGGHHVEIDSEEEYSVIKSQIAEFSREGKFYRKV